MNNTRRIFALIVLGQSLILTGGSYVEYRKSKTLLREVFSNRAELIGKSIGAAYSTIYCHGDLKSAENLLHSYYAQKTFEFAEVTFNEKVITSVGKEQFQNLSKLDLVNQQNFLEKAQVFPTFAEIPPCKAGDPSGEIEIGYNYEDLNAPLKTQLYTQGSILVSQAILMLVAIIFLGKLLQENLTVIIDRCKKIASGNLEKISMFSKDHDFFILSETLNSMCQSLIVLQKEKEEQQAQLVTSSKLSSLGEMAGGVAHEINNPLSIISGKVQQLRARLKNGSATPEQIEKTLDSTENMVQRIAKIIKGLRTFSRDGSRDPYVETLVKTIIDETTPLCQSKFTQADVRLELTEISETLTVNCRATEISQILLNLLNNAFDAVDELPEKWVKVDAIDEGNFVALKVTDSGSGIPLEIQNKMLNPFFTTKPVGKGTGLGLSIASGIAKSHGGSLTIDNSCANTCFILRLPKA